MTDATAEFHAYDWVYVSGRGNIALVQLHQTMNNFSGLVGHTVMIDGIGYFCTGVEYFAHAGPYLKGERIGVLVRGPKKDAA